MNVTDSLRVGIARSEVDAQAVHPVSLHLDRAYAPLALGQLGQLALAFAFQPASFDEADDFRQLASVEPNPVVLANIDDHARDAAEGLPVHGFAACRTRDVANRSLALHLALGQGQAQARRHVPRGHQSLHRGWRQEQAATLVAFLDAEVAVLARMQLAVAARTTVGGCNTTRSRGRGR